MGIKSCLNLLIISVVLGQGIAVALEENKEASSALHLRQKRSSPSSGDIPVQSSPEHRLQSSTESNLSLSPERRLQMSPERRLQSSTESSLSTSLERRLQISPERPLQSSMERSLQSTSERRLRSSIQNINRETSSAVRPPEKGASSSSGISVRETSGLRISEHGSSRRESRGFPQPPRSRVGLEPPAPWKGPLPLGVVRIYHGEKEIGLGFVAVTTCFVAKAHLFTSESKPGEVKTNYYNGEYHIEYRDQNGETVRRDIITVIRNKYFIKNKEDPWGPNDVCIVGNDAGPQKSPEFSNLLEDSKLFTSDQMFWIHTRTGEV